MTKTQYYESYLKVVNNGRIRSYMRIHKILKIYEKI